MALVLFHSAPLAGQEAPPAQPQGPHRHVAVERLMQPYQGKVPGAALLVLKDGEAVISRGYGLADLENGVQATTATNYRLASISKQFTAAAILLLAQEGSLDIDDLARRWLPTLPLSAEGVTLRHLLSHTSGLPDYEDLMAQPHDGQISDAGVLGLLEREEQSYFAAGSQYRYSNSGYALLALVVERASGMDYPEFLRTRIFVPLGMHGTLARVAGGPEVPHRAWGYSATDGGWVRTDQSSTSAVLGDGGIYSNLEDLARWDAALYDDRLLDATSRALAFGRQVQVHDAPGEPGEPGAAYHYGFGWRIDDQRQWHTGETIGFRNALIRWPGQRLTVVVLSNRNQPSPYRLAQEIGELFLESQPASRP